MPRLRTAGIPVVLMVTAMLGLMLPGTARGAEPTRVAIIVGPVGESLTPVYIGLAEAAAAAAEARGAVVARAYSPNATPTNVLAAVEGADIVIYLGHGVGTPNPYSASADPAATNGWGLQGPNARGDHSDSWADGTLAYYGEAWIASHARPAPGWVMIYSNACYAPGASEQQLNEQVTPEVAAERVATYSRAPLMSLGASAYFAIDFYEGAARLTAALLDMPNAPYGQIFAAEPGFDGAGLSIVPHPIAAAAEVWLHRSAYFDGTVDYWYAFAGNPNATFNGSRVAHAVVAAAPGDPVAAATAPPPLVVLGGTLAGTASWYADQAGAEGVAAVALPAELGASFRGGLPAKVIVCADRCVEFPVVDTCPCHVGTLEQRVANLTAAAWTAITDRAFGDGLVNVEVHFDPAPASGSADTPLHGSVSR